MDAEFEFNEQKKGTYMSDYTKKTKATTRKEDLAECVCMYVYSMLFFQLQLLINIGHGPYIQKYY